MVVVQDHGGGIVLHHGADHFPDGHAGPIDGTPKEFQVADDAMAVIQQDQGKDFIGQAVQA